MSSWIQADLGQTRKVTGVVIQGCPGNDHWVTKFKLQHSMDGTTWTDYTADGRVSRILLLNNFIVYCRIRKSGCHLLDVQFLPGSTDRNTPDTQLLGTPVSAKYVRIIPSEFNGEAGLRFDVLGCTPDCKNTTLQVYFKVKKK